MTKTIQEMVREFHEVFHHPISETPEANVPIEVQSLRYDLIREELDELNFAMLDRNIVEVADALGDLLYVVYGTAVVYGIEMQSVVEEIHRSNLTKVGPSGEVEYHPNGKVKKPETFEDPDLRTVIKKQEQENVRQ